MKTELLPAGPQDRAILRNLMQYYMYDFSEFEGVDVDARGRFPRYWPLPFYWKEPGRYAYLIRADSVLAGFALAYQVEWRQETPVYWMAEFFVLRRYRRAGVGRSAACQVFDRLRGIWRVGQILANTPAQAFWRRIIAEYSAGRWHEELVNDPETWIGPVQEFTNS